jgi:uncharacterized surface protein with fasciclin (FAS1) repeats
MKKISTKGRLLLVMVFCLATSFYLTSCKKTVYPLLTNNLLNITGYIENDPAHFSLFDQILQRTGYDGFLQAYGAYTIFVPTDDAVKLYMKSKGKTSINDFNVDSLKDLVRYHVIQNDTINTSFFIDGKLRTFTMLDNQYLTTGVVNINGVSSYLVNGQALMLQSNIVCGNGILHVIDHVLQQPTKTIAQLLSSNPKYTIFTQALVATTFYDTLNVASKNNNLKAYTVFAQTDSVYQSIGIPNFAALKAKYSTLGSDPTKPTDGLYAYVAYHIIAENSYLTDILSKTSHISLSPGQDVISDVLQGTTIQLDYDLINGVQYPGVSVDRPNSNIPATNGVLHTVLGDLFIKVFPPTRVDWDLADQPEFRKQTSIFRVAGKSTVGLNSPLTNITFNSPAANVTYSCQAAGNNTYYWWNDFISLNNFRNTSGQLTDITFTTPVIIKGKYKVWISYQHTSETSGIQFFFDGNAMQNLVPNIFNTYLGNTADVSDSGPVLESKGWKRYTEAPVSTTKNNFYNTVALFYCGTVNITTTDRHLFKLVAIGAANANATGFDMVQFIPYDQDQETPRYFRRDGSIN